MAKSGMVSRVVSRDSSRSALTHLEGDRARALALFARAENLAGRPEALMPAAAGQP
jgi:hypothetical protein